MAYQQMKLKRWNSGTQRWFVGWKTQIDKTATWFRPMSFWALRSTIQIGLKCCTVATPVVGDMLPSPPCSEARKMAAYQSIQEGKSCLLLRITLKKIRILSNCKDKDIRRKILIKHENEKIYTIIIKILIFCKALHKVVANPLKQALPNRFTNQNIHFRCE